MTKKRLVVYENDGRRAYKFDLKAPKTIKENSQEKGIFLESDTHTVKRIKLLKIKGLTEVKTFTHPSKVKTPFGTFTYELPTSYIRKADKDVILEIKVLRGIEKNSIELIIKCAKRIMTSLIPDILAGKIDDVKKAFSSKLNECLSNQNWEDQDIEVNIYICCSCGTWTRI